MSAENDPIHEHYDELMGIANRARVAFQGAGYGVETPTFQSALEDEHRMAHLGMYSHMGAGGMQDAVVSFVATGDCTVAVGPPFLVPQGSRSARDVPDRRVQVREVFPWDTPDLEQKLLATVRRCLLEEA